MRCAGSDSMPLFCHGLRAKRRMWLLQIRRLGTTVRSALVIIPFRCRLPRRAITVFPFSCRRRHVTRLLLPAVIAATAGPVGSGSDSVLMRPASVPDARSLPAPSEAEFALGAPLRLGVNMHPLQDVYAPERVHDQVQRAAAVNAAVIRIDIHWAWLEYSGPGTADWNPEQVQRLEAFLSESSSAGIAVLATVLESPCWASSDPAKDCGAQRRYDSQYPPARAADFATFIGRLATQYGDDISAWEVWNEPNLASFWHEPDPTRYTDLATQAYQAIKKVRPNAIVLAGSLAPVERSGSQTLSTIEYLAAMYRAGIRGSMDALALHPYTDGNPPDWYDARWPMHGFEHLISQAEQTMAANDDAALIWLTEVGWTTVPAARCTDCWTPTLPVSEQEQARYLAAAVLQAEGHARVTNLQWYELQDMPRPGPNAPVSFEHFFGLFDPALQEKPAARRFAELAAVRRGPTETPEPTISPPSTPTAHPTTAPPTITSTTVPTASAAPMLTPTLPPTTVPPSATATPLPSSLPPTPTAIPSAVRPTPTPELPSRRSFFPIAVREPGLPLMSTATATADGALRPHERDSIGSGVFEHVTHSDGLAPFSEAWLWANDHFHIQRIRREEQPSGCDIANYDVPIVWVSAGSQATVTVNGSAIGELREITDRSHHGYIVPIRLRVGDRICIDPLPPSGFHFIFGPDLYWHYDSYCFRGACKELALAGHVSDRSFAESPAESPIDHRALRARTRATSLYRIGGP